MSVILAPVRQRQEDLKCELETRILRVSFIFLNCVCVGGVRTHEYRWLEARVTGSPELELQATVSLLCGCWEQPYQLVTVV